MTPVAGKVTQGGKAFTKGGTITFYPDKSKGNESTLIPTGEIDTSGNYTIKTGDKDGASVGHYKVTVNSQEKADPKSPYGIPKYYVDQMVLSVDKTPLKIEVKDGAGAETYEIKLP